MTTNQQLARIANYLFGNSSDPLIAPTTLYIGLCTGSVSSGGVISGEVSGGAYARVAISNNKSTWSTATTNGIVTNRIDIEFPESTTSWGTISTVFISDQASGGTAQYYATLSTPRNIATHVTVYFKGDPTGTSGDITLSVTN